MTARDYDALLFDFGGVIAEIDFGRVMSHWAEAAGVPEGQVRERFSHGEAYQRHEVGAIDMAAYCDALRAEMGVTLDDARLVDGWQLVFGQPIEPTVRLVRALKGRVPLYLFSNTNLTHYEYFRRRFAEALAPFDRVFVSHEIGLRKPERAAFEHIAREIGVPLPRILFFDDTAANVEAARALDMGAVLVRSPDDVRSAVGGWLDVENVRKEA
ncbi:MAG TPA: HAD family phosphatase [Usitatibacter sp.]|nr:HAD family phosphatase [Usitatibacter sp.]